ncbi:molybdopterin-dependent oxidoreductase [Chitinophaga niabensis]|uniref:Oxidoreductase molybdopterin binding domain-containing protein n=1 Tax=Chitinophaga niabensis TaxID=536979 RepID=A0A1N6JSN3_9BACT|nr:molybdopterin-dependent oxidoreductase [Chitinophaga niabensis]SIO47355.1 Oxidoreductase molybdopterin binding domain-containing protein [Chitinophaga niabensis]
MLIKSLLIIAALFNVTNKVTVKGLVEHPLEITRSNIKAFKPETQKDLKIIGSTGDVKKTFNSYKGVSLKSILDSAKITMPNHKERGKYYIAVKASDGYTTLYSWNDIFNNPTGDHVFLVFEVNGKPIEEDGQFVMVCSNDKITGARHVKWVQEIEVGKLP